VTTEVPTAGEGDGGPTTEELLTAAISGASARTVSLIRAGSEIPTIGVYLPVSKALVTVSTDLPGHLVVRFSDGSEIPADRIGQDGNLMVYGFAPDTVLPAAPSTKLTPSSDVKQGQTVIGLDGQGGAVTGIVSRVDAVGIYANLPGIENGAAVVNLSGAIIGIAGGGGLFLPAERIDALVPPVQ
ncbi:MAG: hypothetical protein WBK28_03935, partial [Minisyncoccia bacterium]